MSGTQNKEREREERVTRWDETHKTLSILEVKPSIAERRWKRILRKNKKTHRRHKHITYNMQDGIDPTLRLNLRIYIADNLNKENK